MENKHDPNLDLSTDEISNDKIAINDGFEV